MMRMVSIIGRNPFFIRSAHRTSLSRATTMFPRRNPFFIRSAHRTHFRPQQKRRRGRNPFFIRSAHRTLRACLVQYYLPSRNPFFIRSAHRTIIESHSNKGSSRNSVGEFSSVQRAGSMEVSTLRRRYSSSRRPYARRWKTRILLLRPSTNPSETLFSGLQ